ncbi:MAG: DUF4159 domain-containing protein [Candidatus Latescibacteria bacterium]|nr:DUF4159 domain-containing protein [Candidatus Latescibacterota bacterium]
MSKAIRLAAFCALFALLLTPPASWGQENGFLSLTRLQYDGGGDWYGNASSLPNLARFVRANTSIALSLEEPKVRLADEELFSHPFIYITGHGNIRFEADEMERLRRYLEGGGFIHADDNYGMDESFRHQLKQAFPHRQLVELPPDHGIFSCHFNLPDGLPKIHQHDGKRPQALGLFDGDRLMLIYTYESDLGDAWEDASVHQVPAEKRLAALQMGTNILVWALTH